MTKKADVVIPVKALSQAKGRLRNVLTQEQRGTLVLSMLQDLLAALRSCELGNIWLVASDYEVFALGSDFKAQNIHEEEPTGYSQAVCTGLKAVDDDRPVAILPGDLPLARAEDLARLIASPSSDGPEVRVVPDRLDQGTNGLFLSSRALIRPRFGGHSFFKHRVAAATAGIAATPLRLPSLAMDIDSANDLHTLSQSNSQGAAAEFLRFLPPFRPTLTGPKRSVA